jgi:hypothetical protein
VTEEKLKVAVFVGVLTLFVLWSVRYWLEFYFVLVKKDKN